MNDILFKTYKDIREQIAALEEQKASLELILFDEFDNNKTNLYQLDGYQFVRMGRKSWEYSPAITLLASDLSKKKKIEELEGIATLKKESQYIRVVRSKEDSA